jgi:hypothetical protein
LNPHNAVQQDSTEADDIEQESLNDLRIEESSLHEEETLALRTDKRTLSMLIVPLLLIASSLPDSDTKAKASLKLSTEPATT